MDDVENKVKQWHAAVDKARLSEKTMRIEEVTEKTGLTRVAIYDGMTRGAFPQQFKLIDADGSRIVGWCDLEVAEYLAERMLLTRDTGFTKVDLIAVKAFLANKATSIPALEAA